MNRPTNNNGAPKDFRPETSLSISDTLSPNGQRKHAVVYNCSTFALSEYRI